MDLLLGGGFSAVSGVHANFAECTAPPLLSAVQAEPLGTARLREARKVAKNLFFDQSAQRGQISVKWKAKMGVSAENGLN